MVERDGHPSRRGPLDRRDPCDRLFEWRDTHRAPFVARVRFGETLPPPAFGTVESLVVTLLRRSGAPVGAPWRRPFAWAPIPVDRPGGIVTA